MAGKLKKHIKTLKSICGEFGYGFMINCLVRRVISFKLYEEYMYRFLTRYFNPIIKEFKERNSQSKPHFKDDKLHIWTLWWQGEENAPDLVKVCLSSQRKMLVKDGVEYHILTQENWKNFVDLPNYILKKVNDGRITLTHLSDIIRAELIRTHGGIWIDATVYCTSPVDLRNRDTALFTVKICENSAFYTLRRWTGFFFGDEKNSLLFDFMAEAFRYYWNKEDQLIVYLLIDYLIAIAYAQFEEVREKIDRIKCSNQKLMSMLRDLNKPFDEKIWDTVVNETAYLKLSYKNEFNGGELVKYTQEGKQTYWGFISDSNANR